MGINNKIEEYIGNVCSEVKCKEAHEGIRIELQNHIEELQEEFVSQGISEAEAVDKAIIQMGEADLVGRQLHKTHKTALDWGLIILTAMLSVIGLLTMFFIESNNLAGPGYNGIFYRTLIFTFMGITAVPVLYFVDYRRMKAYSKHIYIATTLTLIISIVFGGRIHGVGSWIHLGPVSINITSISPFLYTIALAGMFSDSNFNSKRGLLHVLLLTLLPLFLIGIIPDMSSSVICLAAFIIILIESKDKLKHAAVLGSTSLIIFMLDVIKEPYLIKRLLSFLSSEKDPADAGYIYLKLAEAVKSAGMFGKGFTLAPRTIPELHTDFVFTYIIYAFGWAAGIALVVLASVFIVRMFNVTKIVKDAYGRLIIKGFMTIFAVEFLWNILMALGFAPITAVSMPFISFGGSLCVVQMAAVGMILSIYKRKNLAVVKI